MSSVKVTTCSNLTSCKGGYSLKSDASCENKSLWKFRRAKWKDPCKLDNNFGGNNRMGIDLGRIDRLGINPGGN